MRILNEPRTQLQLSKFVEIYATSYKVSFNFY